MTKNFYASLYGLLVAICMCFCPADLMAVTEVHVEKAGTLSSLLTSTDKQLKLSGSINGTDIKFIRELISAGTVISLDLDAVRIVAGGEAYTGSFTTEDNAIGEEMFYGLSKLQTIVLPSTITSIKKNAFAKTGIKKVDIPNSVYSLGEDAFAYCNSLASVVVGKRVKSISKGAFYGSGSLKKAYVKPITPPSVSSYLFSSKPTVYVYKEALADYKASGWKEYYGTIYGTLANTY
ncbi:MAG: leucine-rich repeat domain-containing protein, partial [Bacteroidaceae bacterium]|nr:leucine-rich repeat domain-containing protein [Bacteroidaceae bacterium]